MKLVLIAAVSLLASCKDRPREPSPASSPGSGAPPAAPGSGAAAAASTPDICRISLPALDPPACKGPEVQQNLLKAKRAINGVIDTIGKVGGADRRDLQVLCAQLLLAAERDAAKLSCALAIDARQRQEITALLDAWYGQRTPVAPTGDAAADAVIARFAAMRDAACECRDAACLDRVDQQLGTIGALPPTAPAGARTLGIKLLDDAGRCAARVRTLGDPPR